MQVSVSNNIRIKNYNKEILHWCWEHLILRNPEYYKKLHMGLWLGNTPEQIMLYEKNGDDLILPFGCLRYVWNTYKNTCDFSREIADLRHVDYQSHINLYGYQQEAVESAVKAKNGIIVMPCGSGKTQTALQLIAELGGRTLWLTHTKFLLNQSMERAKGTLDIDTETYGTITEGKVEVGTGITFATVQTMAKINLQAYKDTWDIIVVDECHRAIGSPTKVMQFYKVLSNLSCRYKYGLTATPRRSDGLEQSMFALLGEVIHETPKSVVKDTTCPVMVVTKETGYQPDINKITKADGTIDYVAMANALAEDEERFQLILNAILTNAPTMVLGNRVNYLKHLCNEYQKSGLKAVCVSGTGTSKASKAEREQALQDLNSGKINCIFATYQLAKEGLDVPNLQYIVFATPEKDETTITQAAGRVARKADGKEYGTIIDFLDDFSIYKNYQKKREKCYKKLNYMVLT